MTVRFDGAWPASLKTTLDGSPVAVAREKGGIAVTVDVAAGQPHLLELK